MIIKNKDDPVVEVSNLIEATNSSTVVDKHQVIALNSTSNAISLLVDNNELYSVTDPAQKGIHLITLNNVELTIAQSEIYDVQGQLDGDSVDDLDRLVIRLNGLAKDELFVLLAMGTINTNSALDTAMESLYSINWPKVAKSSNPNGIAYGAVGVGQRGIISERLVDDHLGSVLSYEINYPGIDRFGENGFGPVTFIEAIDNIGNSDYLFYNRVFSEFQPQQDTWLRLTCELRVSDDRHNASGQCGLILHGQEPFLTRSIERGYFSDNTLWEKIELIYPLDNKQSITPPQISIFAYPDNIDVGNCYIKNVQLQRMAMPNFQIEGYMETDPKLFNNIEVLEVLASSLPESASGAANGAWDTIYLGDSTIFEPGDWLRATAEIRVDQARQDAGGYTFLNIYEQADGGPIGHQNYAYSNSTDWEAVEFFYYVSTNVSKLYVSPFKHQAIITEGQSYIRNLVVSRIKPVLSENRTMLQTEQSLYAFKFWENDFPLSYLQNNALQWSSAFNRGGFKGNVSASDLRHGMTAKPIRFGNRTIEPGVEGFELGTNGDSVSVDINASSDLFLIDPTKLYFTSVWCRVEHYGGIRSRIYFGCRGENDTSLTFTFRDGSRDTYTFGYFQYHDINAPKEQYRWQLEHGFLVPWDWDSTQIAELYAQYDSWMSEPKVQTALSITPEYIRAQAGMPITSVIQVNPETPWVQIICLDYYSSGNRRSQWAYPSLIELPTDPIVLKDFTFDSGLNAPNFKED
ncbi:hypothetical protein [Endozoicomonas sp. ONNA1]|uniref:hypothetical protein n=1 Tax=Endozoicomonas sp. ONNA1 TaxID=2828740 RepID=UPI002147821A|nr:hypothetical protein [Endozoicomonas sp. ONNA1]